MPADVQRIYDIQSAAKSVLPTVYQGNYNAVARHVEQSLFPLLRKLKISFLACKSEDERIFLTTMEYHSQNLYMSHHCNEVVRLMATDDADFFCLIQTLQSQVVFCVKRLNKSKIFLSKDGSVASLL